MPEKLYDVLDVDEDASRSQIQQAYRRKVKESHPDISDDPGADERFQLVMRAKEVLTDPDERERYDDLGHEGYMDVFGEDGNGSGTSGGSSSEGSGGSSPTSSGRSASAGSSRDGPSSTSSASSTSSTSASSRSSSNGTGGRSGSSSSSTDGSGTGSGSGADAASSPSSSGASASSSSSSSDGSAATGDTTDASETSTTGGCDESTRSTRGSGGRVSHATVAGEAERTRKEWQAAARRGETGSEEGTWSTSSAQGEHLAAERVETGIATKIRSQDAVEMTVVMLVAYPIFVFATIWPTFPTPVNAVVGVLTIAIVVYTMTEPSVSLVVFGTWSVLTPLLLAFAGYELVSLAGLFALTVAWVPFLLSVLLTLAMPE